MEFADVLFYLFSGVLLWSGVGVISSADTVRSALFLVLAFFNAAAIWLLLKAEFLAVLLVLVYVGAVMVLFLFVVMMLDIRLAALRQDLRRMKPFAVFVGALIIFEMTLILWHGYGATSEMVRDISDQFLIQGHYRQDPDANTHAIGKLIYTDYIFAFEVAGLLLLVATIAAIALTLKHVKERKRTDPGRQTAVKSSDRLRLVKMESEIKE